MLIFSGVDKSSDQFLIQEPVQVLVVGGVVTGVHRLVGDKHDVISWRYKTRDSDIWRCENRWISIARFPSYLARRLGMWPPFFWGRKSEGFFFNVF